MTLILIEKGLVSEGSTLKIEDKQVPGIYIYIYIQGSHPRKLTAGTAKSRFGR